MRGKASKGNFKKVVFLTGSLLLLIAISWLIFFSPVFRIEKIKIEADPKLKEETLKNLVLKKKILFWEIPVNLLMVDKNYFAKIFSLPEVRDVEIKKNFKKRILKIKITKRKEVLIWCKSSLKNENREENICYSTDEEGVAFKNSSLISGLGIPLVKDYTSSSFSIQKGAKITEPQKVSFIRLIYESLKNKYPEAFFSIPLDDKFELIFHSQKLKIFFSFLEDPQLQLRALNETLDYLRKENIANVDYIDLQSLPRVYFK